MVPCRPRTKRPRARRSFSNQRKWEPSRIDRHSKSNPGDNIGIHLDRYSRLHLVVFDLDGDQAGSGVADLFDHEITPTYRVSTAKGHHLYYTTKQVFKSRTRLLPDLDLKATGIVMAPGSIHPSGFRYSVASDLPVATLPTSVENRLVEMGLLKNPPRSSEIGKSAKRGRQMVLAAEGTMLVDAPKSDNPDAPVPTSNVSSSETFSGNPAAYIGGILRNVHKQYPSVKEGKRMSTLNSSAFAIGRVIHLIDNSESSIEVLREIAFLRSELANTRGESPMETHEIDATITGGITAGRARPRTHTPASSTSTTTDTSTTPTSTDPASSRIGVGEVGDRSHAPHTLHTSHSNVRATATQFPICPHPGPGGESCHTRTCRACGPAGRYLSQIENGRWYVVPYTGNWTTIRTRIRRLGYLGMLLDREDAPCFLTTKPDEGGIRLPDSEAVIGTIIDSVRHISSPRRVRMVGR